MLLHRVLTPENVPFNYRIAGPGSRFLALMIDLLIIAFLGFVGDMLASILESARKGTGLAFFLVWVFCLLWLYFLLFEWLWHGQTPGKRSLGIRVIHQRGTSISFIQSAVRNLLRAVDCLPIFYGLGFMAAACNRENRRLGDLAAGTLVVFLETKAQPLHASGVAGWEAGSDRLVLRRLGQLSREQKQTILDLCLRREQLQANERVQLFATVAEFFKARLGLIPEEFQSDEKFILRIAARLQETPISGAAEVPLAR